MPSAELSRRVRKAVAYPPLSEMGAEQRREFHEAPLEADSFEGLWGKWQAAILKAERNHPRLQVVSDDTAPSRAALYLDGLRKGIFGWAQDGRHPRSPPVG